MPFNIYDYVNLHGQNEIKDWTENEVQKSQRGKLDEKLDKLKLYGDALYPDILTGTPVAGIQKLRVRGKVQLRPLLCKGPIKIHEEYTLLKGAKEIGDKWEPSGAPAAANKIKQEVINNPNKRRIDHERVL